MNITTSMQDTMYSNKAALHIFTGPMFAGKTSELLRYLSDAAKAGLKCIYINSSKDTRSEKGYSTHNPLVNLGASINTVKAESLEELTDTIEDYDVIGIDEAQFFPDLYMAEVWVNRYNKNIAVSGLCADINRQSFGWINHLLCQADSIKILTGFCSICAKSGKIRKSIHTYRSLPSGERILVGGQESYMSLCRKCYNEKTKECL